MTYKDELEMILDSMELRRKICQSETAHLPKGRLYYQKNGNYQQYRRYYRRNGELIRETLSKDSDLLKQMKRRTLLESESRILDRDIGTLRKLLSSVRGNEFEEICRGIGRDIGPVSFEDLTMALKNGLLIPCPVDEPDVPIRELELELDCIDPYEWAVMPYRENTLYKENKRHIGITGLRYRSRAEMYIFEHIITERKQPVHYDEVVEINGELFSPDGIAVNTRNEIVLIEYAEMDDRDYLRRNEKKFDAYRRKGFASGRNLLILSSEIDGFINTPKLDKLLDAYLLM